MYPHQSGTDAVEPAFQPRPAPSGDKKAEEALIAAHRALATSLFYPPNHPLCRSVMTESYRAWARLEGDPRLAFTGLRLRGGTLWLGDAPVGAGNAAVQGLAKTLAGHGLVCVLQRRPLTEEGFAHWIALLASPPDRLADQGGLSGAWKRSAFADRLELRRLAVAPTTAEDVPDAPAGGDGGDDEPAAAQPAAPRVAEARVLSKLGAFEHHGPGEGRLLELLLRVGRTDDVAEFVRVLQELGAATLECVVDGRFGEAFQVALFLYREAQNMNALGEEERRDALFDTLRTLLRGPFLEWIVEFFVTEEGCEEAQMGEYILRTVGTPAVVPLLDALVLEKDARRRRRLVDVLVAIGPPVVPHAARLLDDQRWFVVRNMVTILAQVSTPEALRALWRLVGDPDGRIRRELVRAVTAASGPEAEAILLALLDDRDPAVRLMAITAAPSQRSVVVLQALWRLYDRTPLHVPEWHLKVQLLQAVGHMGFPAAAERLRAVLDKRALLWRKRWEVVQAAAVEALGELGGNGTKALLDALVNHRSPAVRRATARALGIYGELRAEGDPCPDD